MKHIAAFALLVLGGNENPSASDVEKVLKEAGVKADSDKIEKMIEAFKGRNFHEMVQGGLAKMASMGAAAGPAQGKAAAVVEEPKEKEEVEEAVDMGGLFGGDDDGY